MTQKKALSIRLLSHSATNGGAALAISALHREFCLTGIDSRLMVSGCRGAGREPVANDGVDFVRRSSKIYGAARRLFHRTWRTSRKLFRSRMADGRAFECLTVPYANSSVSVAELAGDADLLMIGWVAKMIDWQSFFDDIGKVPIVWRLADLNPLTGGCHYPDQCTGFISGCQACPQVSGTLPCKETSTIWSLKKSIFASIPDQQLTFIAQSKWLESLVRSSPLASRFTCEVIPNGVDRDVFYPSDRNRMKALLGLPEHLPTVTVCASSMTRRKGLQELIDELAKRRHLPDFAVIWVGPQPKNVPDAIRFVPFASTARGDLRIPYGAGDFLAFPSFQDNCPNTVLESLACGTPVLAFRGCGTEELICDQHDGVLVEERTMSSFVDQLLDLVSSTQFIRNLQSGAVQSPAAHRSIAAAAQDYLAVFERCIKRMSGRESESRALIDRQLVPSVAY